MKYTLLAVLFLLLTGCGDRSETDAGANIPSDSSRTVSAPDITAGIDMANQEVCRANMQTASSSIIMIQAQTSSLPLSLDEAVSIPSGCPEHGRYVYTVDGNSWRLECPGSPSHGYIQDGQTSW